MNNQGSRQEKTAVLLFLHIPKASGTTLNSIIERQYPTSAIYRTADMATPPAIFDALRCGRRLDELRCVTGHMYFGLHRYLERPAPYITILRHPMRRLISHYAFVRRIPEHRLHAHVIERRLTFEDYVASGLSTELNDGQVRLLCGHEDAETVRYGGVTRAMLDDAKANLQRHFVAVGTTERFDESLMLFQRLLGWEAIEYNSLNKSRFREISPSLGETAKCVVARYNALDLELYDHARQMLDTALAAHTIDRRALLRFRGRLIKYRALRRVRKTIARRLRPQREPMG